MKLQTCNKAQNKQRSYFYLGIAFLMIAWASWKNQGVFYLFAMAMMGLAGYRLYWLDKKLN